MLKEKDSLENSDGTNIISVDPAETQESAAEIAAIIKPHRRGVFALYGDLGSGKTCWVQGFSFALGIQTPVTSPTFTMINEYRNAGVTVFHIDAYRLNGTDEALAMGMEDYLSITDGFTLIEWPERIKALLPPQTISVNFEVISENVRKITIAPYPPV